jgi:hypothetical protein
MPARITVKISVVVEWVGKQTVGLPILELQAAQPFHTIGTVVPGDDQSRRRPVFR